MNPNDFTDWMRDPLNYPPEFKAWLVSYIEANPPLLPIGQIFGFSQYTVTSAPVAVGDETTQSLTYVSLASGPSLSNLPNGKYVVFFGGQIQVIGGAAAYISVSVDGAAASDADALSDASAGTGGPRQCWALAKTLNATNGSNTLALQYRTQVGGSTAHFTNRWLLAMKYSNL